jgi:hypothetical protein
MKSKWIAALLLGSAMTLPSLAQVGVYVGGPPPPLRREVPPPMPGPGYVWSGGYWNRVGPRYAWAPGYWRRPAYAGGYWGRPGYDRYHNDWAHRHWDHERPR